MPGRLQFYTTPDGGSTSLERVRIDSEGRLSAGRNLSSYVASSMSSAANDFIVSAAAGSNGGMSIVNSGANDIGSIFFANGTGENADDHVYGGFTAEDIHNLGLTDFVEYNENNEPDALHYPNMVALMAKAIQELNAKIVALGG